MAQLTADITQTFEVDANYNEQPVADDVKIFRGSATGFLAGYLRQLVAGDAFAGFAEQFIDNTVTGHAAGFKTCLTRMAGQVQLNVTNVAITDIGADVYASDGNTYTLVATNNSLVGKVHRWISTGVAIVSFDVRHPS